MCRDSGRDNATRLTGRRDFTEDLPEIEGLAGCLRSYGFTKVPLLFISVSGSSMIPSASDIYLV